MKVICCGSFDPITVGHEDLILRAAELFSQVIVVVAHNPEKKAFLSTEQRVSLCAKVFAHLPNVSVVAHDGVMVDFAESIGASALVKGVRGGADYEYEHQLAAVNRFLNPRIETILLPARAEVSHISSSYAREFLRLGADLSAIIPEAIRQELRTMTERM